MLYWTCFFNLTPYDSDYSTHVSPYGCFQWSHICRCTRVYKFGCYHLPRILTSSAFSFLHCMINLSVSVDFLPFAFKHYHFFVSTTKSFNLASLSSSPPCLILAFEIALLNEFVSLSLFFFQTRKIYINSLSYSLRHTKSTPKKKG